MSSTTEPGVEARPLVGPVERVVLAADDSHGAVTAADWLAERAGFRSLTIEILVVEGSARSAERHGTAGQRAEGVAWRMREYLSARVPAARATVRVMRGDLVDAVRDAARDGDLLVLGSNRGSAWQHLPLATRSIRIAEAAVRPTVLVPAGWSAGDGPVVAAVSATDAAAIDWAATEATGRRRPLLLVRSGTLPWSVDMPAVPVPDVVLLDEADHRLLSSAADRARSAHPGLDVRTELDHDGVVRELVAHGAQASALVLGAEAAQHRSAVLRGVLEHAPCPVVVVPDDARP